MQRAIGRGDDGRVWGETTVICDPFIYVEGTVIFAISPRACQMNTFSGKFPPLHHIISRFCVCQNMHKKLVCNFYLLFILVMLW